MIQCVHGRGVGAGKSYYTAGRIFETLCNGGNVVITSSFGLDWDACCKLAAERKGVILEREQLQVVEESDTPRIHELTGQGTADCPLLLVIDEAHNFLGSREFNDPAKKAFFKWLTQSRHDDVDVIFISQNVFNIDGQVRRVITNLVSLRNMETWKMLGLGYHPFYRNRFRVSVYDGDCKTLQEGYWLRRDVGIFGIYDSKAMRGKHKRSGLVLGRRVLQRVPSRADVRTIEERFRWVVVGGITVELLACLWLRNLGIVF